MKHGSLFSGIGGFDLAAQWAGLENKFAVEINPFSRKILEKNFPGVPLHEDVRQVGKHNLEKVDILSGGFPCQPFSTAGKRRGKEDERFLWPEMLRIINELQPTWIVGENVAGIVGMALDSIHVDLESIGYEVQTLIIPACAVGAVHKRDRTWIIAYSFGKRFKSCTKDKEVDYKINEETPTLSKVLFTATGDGIQSNSGSIREGDGLSSWVDRVKAMGNAIVPQIAYIIFSYIKAIEEETNGIPG